MAKVPHGRFVIRMLFPPAKAETPGAARTRRARDAAATVCLLRHTVHPYDEPDTHLRYALRDAGATEECGEALRIRGRRARLEPWIQRIDELVVGVNLKW